MSNIGVEPTNQTKDASGVRAPFNDIIALVNRCTSVPVVAIDVPSAWHVDTGDKAHGMRCDTLVSLTTPKLCALHHSGAHYIGGRFVPRRIAAMYELNLPTYAGTEQIVKLN